MSNTTENFSRWALVSCLYGPGTFWSWLIMVASVFISWTINPATERLDSITNDTIAALTLPVVAAVDALYQLAKHDLPDRPRLLLSDSPEDIQLVAALEAPLAICEVYWKRVGCITLSTLLCFSPQLAIFFTYPDLPDSRSTFARPFLFNFVLALGFISGIMAIMTGVSIIRTVVVTMYRRAKPPSTEDQDVSKERRTSNPMVVRLFVLERGGISLDVETIDVMNMENRGLENRKINPRGEYLDEIAQGGKSLFCETPIERAETRLWLRRMDLEIAQPIISWVRNDPGTADFDIGHRIPIPEARLAQNATIQHYLNLLDEQLEGKKYLCVERFSAADIHFYSLMKGKTTGMAPWILHPGRKNVVSYFERMDAREASKKALEVFGARFEAR
ncbi:hypothetical protein FPRO05_10439 [Fusarium proliferatum]|uniref:GST C-terminal domain-containing protein n=1 Tax=Gibberella intermedia TaxID=948311 RepID=A0A365NDA0_GIBIN|nr:hypothetical protein FPRO05_10439 [Fusarium proliferatum]